MASDKLAFIFPGQGSQKIGMLADAAEHYPEICATFAEASSILGYDLWDLSQRGSQQEIDLTERTQPLLLTASVALYRVWRTNGGMLPTTMAGHSLGEWSALVCSGSLAFADGIRLVRERGRLMQAAVPIGQGAMAAIVGLEDGVVEAACVEAAEGGMVAAVNYNSPGQVVIAGEAKAVERAIEVCKLAGAKRALPLPVSAPFHTELMRPAADLLTPEIQACDFQAPEVPIISNVHAAPEVDPAIIKGLMIKQIYSPVRWAACIRAIAASGVDQLVECGPGKVLAGLVRRIDRNMVCRSVDVPSQMEAALATTA
ncbi:MAG: ACP S-malonyltransferase [Gammaproteobacteria bacterium]|nr:ACP S-malonyltransferase [Gammaproteobacteria bacterium]